MPNKRLIGLLTLVVLALGLFLMVTSAMADDAKTRKLISGGGGTIGGLDLKTTVSLDNGVSFQPANIVRRHSAWASRIARSRWISSSPTSDSPPGPYPVTIIFQRQFKLPRKIADPSISVNVQADNGVAVYLNGNLVGAQQCEEGVGLCPGENFNGPPDTFVDSNAAHFLKGQNVLEFRVTEFGGGGGLDYQAIINFSHTKPHE